MRIQAGTSPEAVNIKTVTLDGVDVTFVSQWVDAEAGEVGVYAHRIRDDGKPEILDPFAVIPLVKVHDWDTHTTEGKRPQIEGDYVFTCRGVVAVTFRDSE